MAAMTGTGGATPEQEHDGAGGDAAAPEDARATAPVGAPGDVGPVRGTLLARLRQGPGAGVALVLGAAGLLFVASGSTAQGTDLRADTADLASLVGDERDRAEGTEAQVESLRAEVAQLEAGVQPADPELEGTLASTGEAAGMQAVTGPAVRVVLDDADPASGRPSSARPDDLVIHQQDVQAVVNALWLGGAEAMQLMDQRVISTSAVRCIGNTLSLQGQPYSPPYVITAIGDPDELLAAIAEAEEDGSYRAFVDAVELFGLGYEVDAVGEVEMPAYSGPLELRHAQVRTT